MKLVVAMVFIAIAGTGTGLRFKLKTLIFLVALLLTGLVAGIVAHRALWVWWYIPLGLMVFEFSYFGGNLLRSLLEPRFIAPYVTEHEQ